MRVPANAAKARAATGPLRRFEYVQAVPSRNGITPSPTATTSRWIAAAFHTPTGSSEPSVAVTP